MNANQNSTNDEIDLFYLFKKLNEFFRSCLIGAFRFLLFLKKNWIIILCLVLIGAIAGYFTQRNQVSSKKSSLIIRVNFNVANYIYNSVDLLNTKIANNDSIFLLEEGFWQKKPLFKSIEIEPVINFIDLVDIYGERNATLGTLIENYESVDGSTASESFKFYYKYHKLELVLDPKASISTVDNLIRYFNKNEILNTLKDAGNERLAKEIDGNDEIIRQINSILNNYNSKEPTVSTSNQIILDKDLTGLVTKKTEIFIENKRLIEEMVLSKDIVVLINKSDLAESRPGFLQKRTIVYPMLFVGLFLLFALLKKAFHSVKRMAEAEEGRLNESH
jgi:uncharacterized membrane protein (UPF0136 family)